MSDPSHIYRRMVTIALAAVIAAAVGLVFYRIYFAVQPPGLTMPVLVAVVAAFGLGRLDRRFRLERGGLVIVACLVAYTFDFPRGRSGDVVPTEYTALSIATGRGTSLDDYPELLRGGLPYYVRQTSRGIQSAFAIGPAFLAWPVYLAAPLSPVPRPQLVHRLGNLAAFLMALACVWLVYRIAARLDPLLSPALLALAYGIGTSHWSVSASALWLHGAGELWTLGAIDRLIDDRASVTRRLIALGACLTLAAFARPPIGVGLVLLAVVTLYRYRARAIVAGASSVVVSLPLVTYHLQTYGAILGAYATRSFGMSLRPPAELAETTLWLIASTSRGVLWYEPVVVFTLCAAVAGLYRSRHRLEVAVGVAGFLVTAAVYASWVDWWGGASYGPRYMTDALPWWALATAGAGCFGKWLPRMAAPLVAAGACVNVVGVMGPWMAWDSRPSVLAFPERVRSPGDSQLLVALLGSAPWENHVRTALRAERAGDLDVALSEWKVEWQARPWHQFAAFQTAELMMRTDRLAAAVEHADAMAARWPGHPYAAHLSARLPSIASFVESGDWVAPIAADASRNPERARRVHDDTLGTSWTSLPTRQRKGDWLELRPPPGVAVRGVVLVAAPDFGEGPEGVAVIGITSDSEEVTLAESERITALSKGWVAMRFPAIELERIRVVLTQNRGVAWSVSESRLLLAESN